jgi:PiT family inorganic phosphate transporter
MAGVTDFATAWLMWIVALSLGLDTMVANRGIKNLQGGTVKNIVMAWILTLPVTVILSATLFVFFRWITR